MSAVLRALTLLSLLLPVFACSGSTEMERSRIRWVDPNLVEAFETDHSSLLDGSYAPLDAETADVVLDEDASWYPFLSVHEFDEKAEGKDKENAPVVDTGAPDITSMKSEGGILLKPGVGIASVVAMETLDRIHVRAQGRFDANTKWEATVVELWTLPEMPEIYAPGALKACIKHMGSDRRQVMHHDAASKDGGDGNQVHGSRSASITIKPKPGAKGLLIFVHVEEGIPGLLESVSVTRMTPRLEMLIRRQSLVPDPNYIAEAMRIDGTVMPSFILPPRSELRMKPMRVPYEARFRCSFTVEGERASPIEVVLTAFEENGRKLTAFDHVIAPEQKGWHEQEYDLSELAGEDVCFALESRWKEGAAAPGASPPLLYCGAPQLYSPRRTSEPGAPPALNLIVVSLDTLRQDRLGCYGYDRPVSPSIDALAEKSLLFENAYAQAPYTLASHATLFSGLYPGTHSARSETDRIPDSVTLLSEVLADHGYATASFNGGSFVSHEFGFHQGFDSYCEVDLLCDRSFHGESFTGIRFADGSISSFDRALSWIDRRRNEPFYLFLHTFMVHEYLPPAHWAEAFNEDCESELEPGNESRHYFSLSHVLAHGISDQDLAFAENMYDATIRCADDMVGELVRRLEEQDLMDRTVLVITSDHGEEFMEHGSVKHLQTVYEELIRIPHIVYVPNLAPARIKAAVSHVDFMPTVLDWMGIDCPGPMQGRSLAGKINDGTMKDCPIFAESFMPGRTERWCLIEEGYKYIQGNKDASLRYPAPARHELYELTQDQEEKQNILKSSMEKAESLKSRLEQLREGYDKAGKALRERDPSSQTISPELLELLKQQGYL